MDKQRKYHTLTKVIDEKDETVIALIRDETCFGSSLKCQIFINNQSLAPIQAKISWALDECGATVYFFSSCLLSQDDNQCAWIFNKKTSEWKLAIPGDRYRLRHGDLIGLGPKHEIRYHYEDPRYLPQEGKECGNSPCTDMICPVN